MRTTATVAREMEIVEGFRVRILYPDGRDASTDARGLMPYRYPARAAGSMTVDRWHETRFAPVYPGFRCEVVDGAGNAYVPEITLAEVRERLA